MSEHRAREREHEPRPTERPSASEESAPSDLPAPLTQEEENQVRGGLGVTRPPDSGRIATN